MLGSSTSTQKVRIDEHVICLLCSVDTRLRLIGPDLLLSDVLLFGHLRVLLRRIHGLQEAIYTLLPATGAWVEKMREAEKDLNLDSVLDDKEAFEDALFDFEAAPFDRDESLYSSDPKRKNPGFDTVC